LLEEIFLTFSALRVTSGMNKGEARNTLSRAVFFNGFGEMLGRSIESQSHRASGPTSVAVAKFTKTH
jgi:TnpA family transposase